MQVIGTVVDVNLNATIQKANNAGSYQGALLTYREAQSGQIREQAWHEKVINHPAQATIRAALATLNRDDQFTLTKEKPEGSKFWNITSVTKGAGAVAPTSTHASGANGSSAGALVGGSKARCSEDLPEHYILSEGYSTLVKTFPLAPDHPDRSIVRQNALGNAVAYCKEGTSPEDVIEVARIFENYTTGADIEDAKMQMNLDGLD